MPSSTLELCHRKLCSGGIWSLGKLYLWGLEGRLQKGGLDFALSCHMKGQTIKEPFISSREQWMTCIITASSSHNLFSPSGVRAAECVWSWGKIALFFVSYIYAPRLCRAEQTCFTWGACSLNLIHSLCAAQDTHHTLSIPHPLTHHADLRFLYLLKILLSPEKATGNSKLTRVDLCQRRGLLT